MTALMKICGFLHIGFGLEWLISWGMAVVIISLATAVFYNILRDRMVYSDSYTSGRYTRSKFLNDYEKERERKWEKYLM